MHDALRTLGLRIRDLRSHRGFSQEAFADIAGVHRTYMGHLERGEKNLSFLSMLKVANALGISLSELLTGVEDPKSTATPARRAAAVPAAATKRALDQVAKLEQNIRALKALLSEIGPAPRHTKRR